MVSDWHKSSYSANGGNCVEAREYAVGADVRDTQHRELGHLSFTRDEWTGFLLSIREHR